jgi:hypothetical protein
VSNASLSNVYSDQVDLERVFLKEPWEAPIAVQIKQRCGRGPTRELHLPQSLGCVPRKSPLSCISTHSFELTPSRVFCKNKQESVISRITSPATLAGKILVNKWPHRNIPTWKHAEPTQQTRTVPGALSGWPPNDSHVDLEGSQISRPGHALRYFSFRN